MKQAAPGLFETSGGGQEPLASRMRPRTISEYVGQDHIMGPGRLLRRAIQADQLSSIIFSGPPGTGKTTLARVIAGSTTSEFVSLNAVLSGVNEIREAIENAKNKKSLYDRKTILFVDEVHRWNKAQQDALLPWVENGTFVLIGATTENPYFEVNAALVSRSRVFQLRALNESDLHKIAQQALSDPLRGYGKWRVRVDEDALSHLVATASGDARSLLNALELAVETTPLSWPPPEGSEIKIDIGVAEESIQQKALLYDRDGDYHYDAISAFIKSIRGSDPDAALYWMARMIRSGENPSFVLRRLMISASEDIGMADPNALIFVQNAASAFDRVGMPEGQFFLTHATIYLATAPKSNSAMGYYDALKALESEDIDEVPNHLKDNNRDKKGFGHGEGYQYPHAFKDHWVAQNYLPNSLRGRLFYQPGELGFEGTLQAQILERRELQGADAHIVESTEHLTWSPINQTIEHFARRAEAQDEVWLRELRTVLFNALAVARHERIAVIGGESSYLLPEALRRVPEGLVYVAQNTTGIESARHQAEILGALDRCRFLVFEVDEYGEWNLPVLDDGPIEKAVCINLIARCPEVARSGLLKALKGLVDSGSTLICAEQIPARAPKLSYFMDSQDLNVELRLKVKATEESFYGGLSDTRNFDSWLGVSASTFHHFMHNRTFTARQVKAWIQSERAGSYGAALREGLSPSEFEAWSVLAESRLVGKTFEWPMEFAVYHLAPANINKA